MEPVKIVMRYADGKIVKGFTGDFAPNKAVFHVSTVESGVVSDKVIEISVKELKAIFFVKDFSGDPSYDESKQFSGTQPPGRKVEVTFSDGEVMVGSTAGYDRNRPGFFIQPADSASNNLRVYAVSSAVKNVRFL